jgi:hypothetical protein
MVKKHCTTVSWLTHGMWRALLCALALVYLSAPALAAEQTLTGTFLGKGTGREVPFNHHGKPLSDWAGTLKFRLDSGEELLVFCIQIDVRVSSGDRYRSDGPVLALPNGCKIRYLLDKYPGSTAKDVDEAAARQMAIWVFSDAVDPATIEDAKIRDRTIALVTEATGKPCPERRTDAPDLTLDPPNTNAAIGQVVAYSVSASAQDAGHTLTVTVNGPAMLSDANGNNSGQQQQQVTLDGQGAATFWVLSTGVGEAIVRVALPYRLEAGTVFSQLDDGSPSQRLVMAESKDLVANAAAQLLGTAAAPAPSASPLPPVEQATTPAETPTPPTALPPPPTRRPSKPDSTEQPAATAVVDEQTTAAPIPAPIENLTAIPDILPPMIEAAVVVAPAGAAAPPLPRSLPNTAEAGDREFWPILIGVVLLLTSGWLLRRRAMQ